MLQLLSPEEVKFAPDGAEAGRIEGYASVFGLLDRVGDIVEPGAYKSTLQTWKKSKQPLPALWHHDMSEPVGVWTEMEEDTKGLKVAGTIFSECARGPMARKLAMAGALRLSIGYRSMKDSIDRQTGARRLQQVELYEISFVTRPALPEAVITSAKQAEEINPRELEQALREAGLSRADAVKAVAVFRTKAARDASVQTDPPHRDDGLGDLLMAIRAANAAMAST
jgi:uncharacterized protein